MVKQHSPSFDQVHIPSPSSLTLAKQRRQFYLKMSHHLTLSISSIKLPNTKHRLLLFLHRQSAQVFLLQDIMQHSFQGVRLLIPKRLISFPQSVIGITALCWHLAHKHSDSCFPASHNPFWKELRKILWCCARDDVCDLASQLDGSCPT